MYPAAAIANYFIDCSNADRSAIDQMKIQKLVYYAHGWYLGMTGQALIDEQIEAWRFGPVVPSLYHALKNFGNQPVTDLIPTTDSDSLAFDVQAFLDKIWDSYSHLTGIQLSNLTHQNGSPWSRMAKRYGFQIPANKPLDNDSLRAYFVALGQKLTKSL